MGMNKFFTILFLISYCHTHSIRKISPLIKTVYIIELNSKSILDYSMFRGKTRPQDSSKDFNFVRPTGNGYFVYSYRFNRNNNENKYYIIDSSEFKKNKLLFKTDHFQCSIDEYNAYLYNTPKIYLQNIIEEGFQIKVSTDTHHPDNYSLTLLEGNLLKKMATNPDSFIKACHNVLTNFRNCDPILQENYKNGSYIFLVYEKDNETLKNLFIHLIIILNEKSVHLPTKIIPLIRDTTDKYIEKGLSSTVKEIFSRINITDVALIRSYIRWFLLMDIINLFNLSFYPNKKTQICNFNLSKCLTRNLYLAIKFTAPLHSTINRENIEILDQNGNYINDFTYFRMNDEIILHLRAAIYEVKNITRVQIIARSDTETFITEFINLREYS